MAIATSAKRTVTITNPAGLHARPSAAIAQVVRRFQSRVQIRSGDQVVNASSILELLTLGARQGSSLVLTAKGPDAEQVLEAVVEELSKHYD
jgi:phosphocarrier protein HPr